MVRGNTVRGRAPVLHRQPPSPTHKAILRGFNFRASMKRRGKSTQGSTSGTLLQTVNTCYNGAASPCTSTAITLPITQWSVTNQLGNTSGTSKVAFTYNSFGLVTEEDDYDFGASTPIKKTVISYASLGNGIVGMPSSVKIQDGGGNTKAERN